MERALVPGDRKWWTWGLEREMSRRGVELFHGTDFSVPYLRRRPSVLTLHDLSPWIHADWASQQGELRPGESGRVRRRTPLLLRLGLASMVITPSEAVRRAAIERFRLNPDRVVSVPLAAAEGFCPWRRRQLAPIFFPGNAGAQKERRSAA